MPAEPDVALTDHVRRWVHGWAKARGVDASDVRPGALHVRLDGVSRREELVLVEPTEADLAQVEREHRGDEDVWVTVVPPFAHPPDGFQLVEHAEALMATVLADPPAPDRPGLTREALHGDPDVVHLRYLLDGDEAARGVVAVDGEVAVFDRILTADAFRRQGFGRDVMAALTVEARSRGASRGLLVASAEGQALYERLGWSTLSRVTTYCPVASG